MSYYPPPPQQNIWRAQPPVSGLAITGFIVSCVGCLFTWIAVGLILCPLGIIFSSIGMSQTGPGKREGRWASVAGLVLGIVGLAFSLLILLMVSTR